MTPALILASGSPQRKALLRQLGVAYTVQPSHVDETCSQRLPKKFVEELALRKAKATAERLSLTRPYACLPVGRGALFLRGEGMRLSKTLPSSLRERTGRGMSSDPVRRRPLFVLGADTVVVLGRKILGKPADLKDAYRMLYRLSNSTHRVYTGVALVEVGGQRQWVTHAVSSVRMKKMPLDAILKYSGKHLDKAGAYAIQDREDPYAHVVKGSYENVVGLPLDVTADLLRKAGFTRVQRRRRKSKFESRD